MRTGNRWRQNQRANRAGFCGPQGLPALVDPKFSGPNTTNDQLRAVQGAHAPAPEPTNRLDGGVGPTAIAGPGHRCNFCNRNFSSFPGLRLHQRRAHPTDYHQSVANTRLTISRPRWDPDESRLLAIKEAELGASSNINQRLLEVFPGRSLESIKCHRKQRAYRHLGGSHRSTELQHRSSSKAPHPGCRSAGACSDVAIGSCPGNI